MDLDATTQMLAMFAFPPADEQAGDAWLGGALPAYMKEVADFLAEQGQIDSALSDYSGTIDASFLK